MRARHHPTPHCLLLFATASILILPTHAQVVDPVFPLASTSNYRSTIGSTFMSIDSPPSLKGDLAFEAAMVGLHWPITATTSTGIPYFTSEIVMPHILDDGLLCTTASHKTNEFNETFAGKVILVMLGSCPIGSKAKIAESFGAAGVIMYGCPVGPPTNCQPGLTDTLSGSEVTKAASSYIQTADGEKIVAYLRNKNALRSNGNDVSAMPIVSMRVITTGPMTPAERAALSLIAKSTTNIASYGGLRLLNNTNVDDPTLDPCIDRLTGIYCENGRVVHIFMRETKWSPLVLGGPFPAALGSLTGLRYFQASSNRFGGALPDSFCNLTQMMNFNIGGQISITGGITSVPSCLSQWSSLHAFRVTSNSISSPLPDFAAAGPGLMALEIQFNKFTSFPVSISSWTGLQTILAGSNQLTNFPPLTSLPKLTEFDINTNLISQVVTNTSFDCPAGSLLTSFDISQNSFFGVLPNFSGCSSLLTLKMDFNQFSSSIPTVWKTNIPNLITLTISHNQLISPIRPLVYLLFLQRLDLSYNQLTTNSGGSAAAIGMTDTPGLVFNMASGPSLVYFNVAHNNFTGAWNSGWWKNPTTLREVYLQYNQLTGLPSDLFERAWTTLDVSNNNISLWQPSSAPTAKWTFLNLRNNPLLKVTPTPSWMAPVAGEFVFYPGSTFTCPKVTSSSNAQASVSVDPIFNEFKGCKCSAGNFGAPPLCYPVPLTATLSHGGSFTSSEIGSNFQSVVLSTSNRTISNATGAAVTDASDVDTSFEDEWYGDDRLTQGVSTSFLIDLRAEPDSTADPIRYITVHLHLSRDLFSKKTDQLSVYQGDSDESTVRVLAISGLSKLPQASSSDYTTTASYQAKYGAKIARLSNPVLLEVIVLGEVASIAFSSRDTKGAHFFATYSSSTSCPDSYFWDSEKGTCRPPLELYALDSGIRSAIYASSSFVLAYVLVCLVFTLYWFSTPVMRAASRSFLVLMLAFFAMMSLGSLLYAAVPDESSQGKAICAGRVWMSVWPLTGVLAIILAKTNRLNNIFGATVLQVRKVSDMELFLSVAVMLSITTIFLAIYSGLPLNEPRVMEGTGSLTGKLVSSCHNLSGFGGWIAALLAYVFLLTGAAAYLAFKTRNLPSRFNESQHLMNAILLILFYGAIIVPLDFMVQGSPETAMLIQGLGQSFLTLLLTSIIFLPKFYVAMSGPSAPLQGSVLNQPTKDGKYSTDTPDATPQPKVTPPAVRRTSTASTSQQQRLSLGAMPTTPHRRDSTPKIATYRSGAGGQQQSTTEPNTPAQPRGHSAEGSQVPTPNQENRVLPKYLTVQTALSTHPEIETSQNSQMVSVNNISADPSQHPLHDALDAPPTPREQEPITPREIPVNPQQQDE